MAEITEGDCVVPSNMSGEQESMALKKTAGNYERRF